MKKSNNVLMFGVLGVVAIVAIVGMLTLFSGNSDSLAKSSDLQGQADFASLSTYYSSFFEDDYACFCTSSQGDLMYMKCLDDAIVFTYFGECRSSFDTKLVPETELCVDDGLGVAGGNDMDAPWWWPFKKKKKPTMCTSTCPGGTFGYTCMKQPDAEVCKCPFGNGGCSNP